MTFGVVGSALKFFEFHFSPYPWNPQFTWDVVKQ